MERPETVDVETGSPWTMEDFARAYPYLFPTANVVDKRRFDEVLKEVFENNQLALRKINAYLCNHTFREPVYCLKFMTRKTYAELESEPGKTLKNLVEDKDLAKQLKKKSTKNFCLQKRISR